MNGLMERFWENSSGAQSRNSASNKLSHKLTFSTGFSFNTLCELGGFLQVSHNLHHYPNPHHHHYHHLRKVKIPTAVWRAGFDSAWRFPGGDINVLHDIEIFLKIFLAWCPDISKDINVPIFLKLPMFSTAWTTGYVRDFQNVPLKAPNEPKWPTLPKHSSSHLFPSQVKNCEPKRPKEDLLG